MLVDAHPALTLALFILANIELQKSKIEDAIELLVLAHAQDSSETKILALLAQCYEAMEKYEQALECYLKLRALNPDEISYLCNVGILYSTIREYESARTYLQEALARAPDNTSLLNCYAGVLMNLGDLDQAITLWERAIELKPENPNYHGNLAQALLWKEDIDGALEQFRRSAHMHFAILKPPSKSEPLRVSRTIHDFEQLQHLVNEGLADDRHEAFLAALEPIAARARVARARGEQRISCDAAEYAALAPFFNQVTHIGDGGRVPGKALNPNLDVADIENRYGSSFPEILVLDDVLTEEALEKLYNYCLDSRIFLHENESGYLGALLSQGFASPLLLQVSEEIRKTFSNIFKEHRLAQSWAFKYDSTMHGIKTHADFATVNMNFWISPDAGNLDPEHGGLVVWNKESPKDWNLNDYNGNEEKVMRFLRESKAEEVTIPFKRNRAAIFNSNLFHRTDTISFSDDYKSRRINVTFLYGAGLRH